MSATQPKRKSLLTGIVNPRFQLRELSGWVRCSACTDLGNDTAITVLNHGRVIGSGVADSMPWHVKHPQIRAFQITCNETFTHPDIAFGGIVVEARDAAGHYGKLSISHLARSAALRRILEHAPPPDHLFAASILGWLGGSRKLPVSVIAQLRACRDALLPPREVPPAGAVAAAQDPATEAERRFWFRFESLAGDCTLGMMQRRAGAEPLDLLRFTNASVDSIRNALKTNFAGVGSPEFTRLEPNDRGEYMSRDTRYGMLAHTFIYEGEMPFERLFQQHCRKIAYLARNLLEDIIEGDRIFVVYNAHHSLDPVKVRQLHRAIRERGPGWLVDVQSLEADNSAIGTATQEADGLITAYIGPLEMLSPAERVTSWRAACGAAAAIVDASRSSTQVAAK
jgi:hypothetical protein